MEDQINHTAKQSLPISIPFTVKKRVNIKCLLRSFKHSICETTTKLQILKYKLNDYFVTL